MEVMFSYQKVDQWSPPLSDQQGRAQSRSGCWAGLGHNWPWEGVIMGTCNPSIFIMATLLLPLVCTHTHISWHDKTFHDHDYDCLHVYFSKAHPLNRRYSARIKTSNVYNTWAPVNPIIQGTTGCPKKNALSELCGICVGTKFFGYFGYFEQASL